MKDSQSANPIQSFIADDHQAELKASAIDYGIAALNFWSFDGTDENELDQVFSRLKLEPEHNNNGTLSGKTQQELSNILYGGGWVFEGHSGVCVKLNSPRKGKDEDGKEEVIKYESVRGKGNLQLFVPKVTFKIGLEIASKSEIKDKYIERFDVFPVDRSVEDTGFWDWVLTLDKPLQIIVTEGAKKACSLISAGYLAIGLNGMWGWGSNVKAVDGEKADKDGTKLDDKGKKSKLIHPDLEPFLKKNVEIVWALDRDENRANPEKHQEAIKGAKQSKASFKYCYGSLVGKISDTVWEKHKGVDDLIASEGVGAFYQSFRNRSSKKVVPRVAGNKSEPKTSSENIGSSTSEGSDDKKSKETAGEKALRLAKLATYFDTADKVAYADIPIEGSRQTCAVRSRSFRLWLTGEFYRDAGYGLSPQVLTDLFPTLEAMAICDGETREVYLRTAEHQGKLYLDLGTPDWKTVEIDSTGWRVISEPPVRFWRPDSLLPLPYPVEGGNLDELKDLLNVDRQSWVMIATFLLFCFCPDKTYPILVLTAHRGSGKTAAAEILKSLIDPGKAGLIKLQGDTHKLAIAATRRLLMVYDNVGYISPDQSDDLCRIATGFGYSTRTLHTTDEETTFEFTRPQIITAIDALVTRDDLADRVLMAQLPEIPAEKRLPQSELHVKVESSRPRILGALLTALSQTLAELPHVQSPELPRMADYAKFAIASEKALNLRPDEFMMTFDESREQARQTVLESSPLNISIIKLMDEVSKTSLIWKGTASNLLNELERLTDRATFQSRSFPSTPYGLSLKLNRAIPDLREWGIDIGHVREGKKGSRIIYIQKVVKTASAASAASGKQPNTAWGNGFAADGADGAADGAADAASMADKHHKNSVSHTVSHENPSIKDLWGTADTADAADAVFTSLPVVGEAKIIREVPEDEF
jgi:hypothetical protein